MDIEIASLQSHQDYPISQRACDLIRKGLNLPHLTNLCMRISISERVFLLKYLKRRDLYIHTNQYFNNIQVLESITNL